MKEPSTAWQETIRSDEDARFEGYARQLVTLQREISARHGKGRALHRKQHLGLAARVEVLGDLPAHARVGMFSAPQVHEAQIRLSNGTGRVAPDKNPDVRGFSIRVLGIEGPGALGAPTEAQCFLLINRSTFALPTAEEFMGVVMNASRGPLALVGHLIKRHGLFGGLKRAGALAKGLGKPFVGFACDTFHSAAPIAMGRYAAKVRLVPAGNGQIPLADPENWSADMIERLAKADLHWDLQLQFFVDEATTPIENPTIEWPEDAAPFVTVARVIASKQDPSSVAGTKLAEAIEHAKFDPWAALDAHRPLGEIMRARKVAYFASQKERGVA